ncbi:hypothetical protein [Serratia sp. M24T3]|nr:hypothetical protein [Serratia sp. M24T3]
MLFQSLPCSERQKTISTFLPQLPSFEDSLEAWRYFDSRQQTGKVVISIN